MDRLVTGNLRRYLQASRGRYCLLLPGPELSQLYEDAFSVLVAELGILLQAEFTPPELVVAYSGTAHAETVGLAYGRSAVVYDQYLGQVLNRLNRLHFEQAPQLEVSAYLNKLSASRCLIAGRPRSALRHAALFAALIDHVTPANHHAVDQRPTYSIAGEVFVLAHEMTHYLYRTDPQGMLLIEDYYLELIAAVRPGDRGSPKTTRGNRVARISAATSRLNSRQQSLREQGEAAPRRSGTDAINQFKASLPGYLSTIAPLTPDLLEECVCDGVAALVSGGWALQNGIRIGDSALASFLALHNLRLLRWIDTRATYVHDDAPAGAALRNDLSEAIVGQTQLRFDLFRYIVSAWLSGMWNHLQPDTILPGGPRQRGGAAGLIDAMIDLNEQYADVIFDHATSSFEANFTESLATTNPDSVLRREPGEDDYDVVRRVCDLPGWRAPTRPPPQSMPAGYPFGGAT